MEKKSTWFKKLGIVFAISLFLSLFYLISKHFMASVGWYYRNWVVVIGEMITFFVMPVSLFVMVIGGSFSAAAKGNNKSAGIGLRAAGVLCCLIAFLYFTIGSLWYLVVRSDVFEKETFLDDHIIEGVTQLYPEDSWSPRYEYYESVPPLLKKSYRQISVIMEQKAEEKYGESFTVDEEDLAEEKEASIGIYTLHPDSNPELEVHMFSNHGFYYGLNDYQQVRANALLEQNSALKEMIQLPEKIDTKKAYNPENGLTGEAAIVFSSLEEAVECARLVAEAVNEILQDDFYGRNGNTASVTVRYKVPNEEGEQEYVSFQITFGDMDGYRIRYHNYSGIDKTKADSADPETIAEILGESYAYYAETVEQKKLQEQEKMQEQSGEDGTVMEPDTSTPETVEGAYKCLYEQVFEPLGDAYDCYYNAKGNFYGVLSVGKGKLDGETEERDTMRSVVYDRVSKNEACHLFVYYETFYNEDGSEYTTAIRNTYAVNMETGEVTESGKHAWADVGTAGYQEAAGEK